MGMDLSHQAIPHNSPALQRARRDGLFGGELEFMRLHASGDPSINKMYERARQNPRGEEDRAFVDAVDMARQAAREHPGIESRHLSWGRGYDAIYYLLSPACRAGEANWSDLRDWAGEAIFGHEMLNEKAVTTIGFKIRYTPPELVREHAELLQIATKDDLREHFDPQRMSQHVYKYFGDPDGFEDWIWPQFAEWRDFLISMLSFPDEGLLCCVG